MITDSASNSMLINFISISHVLFTMKNIIFRDSAINNVRSIFLYDNPEGTIIVDTVLFTNVTTGDSTSFLMLHQAKTFTANSINFENWDKIKLVNGNNCLIDLSEISSKVDGSIFFNKISVKNTGINVIKISNVLQPKDINQSISFGDITVQDSNYNANAELISTENIKSNNSFRMIFNHLIMQNLNFR